MKIAVSGKGGVGKTTISALLGKAFADEKRVYLIDADPDANLAGAMGVAASEELIPLVARKEMIKERTLADGSSLLLKMNPHIEDIPDKFGIDVAGMRLLLLGTIYKGGTGCACPENTFLRSLLSHLILGTNDVVIVDMAAGIEHLGRATVQGIDVLIVVVEPGRRSIHTALQTRKLAHDIHLTRMLVVANKISDASQLDFMKEHLTGMELFYSFPYSEEAQESDASGQAIFEAAPAFLDKARELKRKLEAYASQQNTKAVGEVR
jgi:CO dehydrogenase maturation factor